MCCSGRKVRIPVLQSSLQPLFDLLDDCTAESKQFLHNIRRYKSAFQMTSFGTNKHISQDGFQRTFRVEGQVNHLIGLLLPSSDGRISENLHYGEQPAAVTDTLPHSNKLVWGHRFCSAHHVFSRRLKLERTHI